MTKAELIAEVQALPRFKGVVTAPVLERTNVAGDNIYRCNIRVLKGGSTKIIRYINVYFVVIDEGEPAEEAYIMDRGTLVWE